jgi:hypothetical protein
MNILLRVWLPSHSLNVTELLDMASKDPARAAGFLAFTHHDMTDRGWWTEVGTATAAVTLLRRHDASKHQIEALRTQIDKIKDEAQARVEVLEDRIRTLAALEAPK